MHLAAAEGHVDVVAFLLECGVDPNQPDRWGGTPLQDAMSGSHDAVVELLKANKAELREGKHLASDGDTSPSEADGNPDDVVEFLWAACNGSIRGLQHALANGVAVNSSDYDGRTALHLAAAEGNLDAVEYLLAHGHPHNVWDRWKATPIDEARREDRAQVVRVLEKT